MGREGEGSGWGDGGVGFPCDLFGGLRVLSRMHPMCRCLGRAGQHVSVVRRFACAEDALISCIRFARHWRLFGEETSSTFVGVFAWGLRSNNKNATRRSSKVPCLTTR